MELPKHYLPVRVCPHVGIDWYPRFLFSDYGSYQNVNVSIETTDSKESISCWPQKGQNTIKDLNKMLPLLPLFDHPLQNLHEDCEEKDSILGVKSFNETLGYMTNLVNITQHKKGSLRKNKKGTFAKKFKALKETYVQTGEFGEHFKDNKTLQNLTECYHEISKAYNMNCLNGFNRDFYGGLLSVAVSHDRTLEYISYAGGADMKDIYVAAVSEESNSCLKTPELVCQNSTEDSVYQIDMSVTSNEQLLVCSRGKQNCHLYAADIDGKSMTLQNKVTTAVDCWTSTSFSPYLGNEMLLSSSSGDVYLWDITQSSEKLVEKSSRFHCPDSWSCAYFAGHPREIVVADNTSVEIFDHRSHFKNGQELFSLSSKLITVDEKVMAAGFMDFPYHAVATDFALFIMDQRFGSVPVFQWYTEFKAAPQYLKVLNNKISPGKLIFLATQQPAEVICFPVNIHGGEVPRSSLLPWKLSALGDFNQNEYRDYICDMNIASRKFNTSLAGMAVSKLSRSNGFTVFQMDSFGDIFYQSVNLHGSMMSPTAAAASNSDRQKARAKINNWLSSFDGLVHSKQKQDLRVPAQTIDPDIIKDIFQSSVSISLEEQSTESNKELQLPKQITGLSNLPCARANTKLLLALRDGSDITDCLKEREDYHNKEKKRMREKNILKKEKSSRNKSSERKSSFRYIVPSLDYDLELDMNNVSYLSGEKMHEPLVIDATDRQLRSATRPVIRNTSRSPSPPSSLLLFEDENESFDSSGSLFDVTKHMDSESSSDSDQLPNVKARSSSVSVSDKSLRVSVSSLFKAPTYTSTPNKRKPKRSHSAQKPKKTCQKVNLPIPDLASNMPGAYTKPGRPTSPAGPPGDETRGKHSSHTNLLVFPPYENSTEAIMLSCDAQIKSIRALECRSPISQWEGAQLQVNANLANAGANQEFQAGDESCEITPLLQNFHLRNQTKLDMTLICETLFKDNVLTPAGGSGSQMAPLTQGDENLPSEVQGTPGTPLRHKFKNGTVSAEQAFTQMSSSSNRATSMYKKLPQVNMEESYVTSSQKSLFTDRSSTPMNASDTLEMCSHQELHTTLKDDSASLFDPSQPNMKVLNVDTTQVHTTQVDTVRGTAAQEDNDRVHLLDNYQGSGFRLRGSEIFGAPSQEEPRAMLGIDSVRRDPHQGVIQWLHHNGNQSFENQLHMMGMEPHHSSVLDSSADMTVVSRHTLTSWSPCANKDNPNSSDSDSESTNSVYSSLPASLRKISLSNPKMKHFVDPNLAGFLSSPKRLKKNNSSRTK